MLCIDIFTAEIYVVTSGSLINLPRLLEILLKMAGIRVCKQSILVDNVRFHPFYINRTDKTSVDIGNFPDGKFQVIYANSSSKSNKRLSPASTTRSHI